MYAVYSLAAALHKTVAELMQMSQEEFTGWLAFFKLRKDRGGG